MQRRRRGGRRILSSFRTTRTENDGVDGLEVRRVGHQDDLHLLAGHAVHALVAHAQMILDIAAALVARVQIRVELSENQIERLAAHVRQNV